jgi:hypothetical protein
MNKRVKVNLQVFESLFFGIPFFGIFFSFKFQSQQEIGVA